MFSSNILRAEYQFFAKRRGHEMSIAELQALDDNDLLSVIGPPGLSQRKREWDEYHARRSGASGFCCDIDHHPETKGVGCGMLFPVQLTHGMILSYGQGGAWRIATAKEHMVANGFHATPTGTPEDFGLCPLISILDGLGVCPQDIKKMSGNGMNLVTQASWMAYVLSNIQRIG